MSQVDEQKTERGGDGRGSTTAAGPVKVSFEPEQQLKVQELIDDAYKRAYAKAQRSGASSGEVERLKQQLEVLKEDRKTAMILRSLSNHNVVDAEEVAELIRRRIRLDDDGRCSVIGESGAALIDASGRPLGLDEYVGRWLGERPHHLRSTGAMGSGSHGVLGREPGRPHYDLSDPSVWRSIPRHDLDRLLREGVEVHGSAGQVYRFKDVKNPFLDARKKRSEGDPQTG